MPSLSGATVSLCLRAWRNFFFSFLILIGFVFRTKKNRLKSCMNLNWFFCFRHQNTLSCIWCYRHFFRLVVKKRVCYVLLLILSDLSHYGWNFAPQKYWNVKLEQNNDLMENSQKGRKAPLLLPHVSRKSHEKKSIFSMFYDVVMFAFMEVFIIIKISLLRLTIYAKRRCTFIYLEFEKRTFMVSKLHFLRIHLARNSFFFSLTGTKHNFLLLSSKRLCLLSLQFMIFYRCIPLLTFVNFSSQEGRSKKEKEKERGFVDM